MKFLISKNINNYLKCYKPSNRYNLVYFPKNYLSTHINTLDKKSDSIENNLVTLAGNEKKHILFSKKY